MRDAAENATDISLPGDAWALRSTRVVTSAGVRPAAILVVGERIAEIVSPDAIPASCPVEDVGERVVLPGLVDTHVHINEPGRTEWEGFASASRAAAAGGITTLVDMPLNSSPVVTTVAALALKEQAARGQLWVDCGYYGGVVPAHLGEVERLIEAGVLGLKAFLCHSGIDEFPNATEADLRVVMPALARRGRPLLVHAELPPDPRASWQASAPQCRSYARYLASRPAAWEHDAIRLMIALCREYNCRVHIVHLASAAALPMIAEARREGLPLTVETCPHYLTFAAEEIPDGDPLFKCAPPIRDRANREGLWEGLQMGLIDTIGSDHSPAPPELKQCASGDLSGAWGGIASLQLGLPAVWTEARKRGWPIEALAEWMAAQPAALVGLAGRKGQIAPGCDADFCVVDPDATFTVDPAALHHRHPITPYAGRCLAGQVEATYLRGRAVFRAGRFLPPPRGQSLRAEPAGLEGSQK